MFCASHGVWKMLENAQVNVIVFSVKLHLLTFAHISYIFCFVISDRCKSPCEAWPRAISEGNALVLNTVGDEKIWDGDGWRDGTRSVLFVH